MGRQRSLTAKLINLNKKELFVMLNGILDNPMMVIFMLFLVNVVVAIAIGEYMTAKPVDVTLYEEGAYTRDFQYVLVAEEGVLYTGTLSEMEVLQDFYGGEIDDNHALSY